MVDRASRSNVVGGRCDRRRGTTVSVALQRGRSRVALASRRSSASPRASEFHGKHSPTEVSAWPCSRIRGAWANLARMSEGTFPVKLSGEKRSRMGVRRTCLVRAGPRTGHCDCGFAAASGPPWPSSGATRGRPEHRVPRETSGNGRRSPAPASTIKSGLRGTGLRNAPIVQYRSP